MRELYKMEKEQLVRKDLVVWESDQEGKKYLTNVTDAIRVSDTFNFAS
jgi:hypothetical protein